MNSIFNMWLVLGLVSVFAVAIIRAGTVTPAEQCAGESFDNLRDRVQVIPCGATRCKLPKNSNITVIFKFAPKKEVKSLTNDVYAMIGGIPLPFIGVSGTSACADVVFADSGKPAACPLAANHEYIYTNIFPVLSVYPSVAMRVHWSLDDGNDKVICFEVPATITKQNAKRKSLL